MALQCGIVGLPNVGKSTLFNALSSAKAEAANFPFCTIEPNLGTTSVPDPRLEKLEELSAEIVAAGGEKPVLIAQDMYAEDACKALSSKALKGI